MTEPYGVRRFLFPWSRLWSFIPLLRSILWRGWPWGRWKDRRALEAHALWQAEQKVWKGAKKWPWSLWAWWHRIWPIPWDWKVRRLGLVTCCPLGTGERGRRHIRSLPPPKGSFWRREKRICGIAGKWWRRGITDCPTPARRSPPARRFSGR